MKKYYFSFPLHPPLFPLCLSLSLLSFSTLHLWNLARWCRLCSVIFTPVRQYRFPGFPATFFQPPPSATICLCLASTFLCNHILLWKITNTQIISWHSGQAEQNKMLRQIVFCTFFSLSLSRVYTSPHFHSHSRLHPLHNLPLLFRNTN